MTSHLSLEPMSQATYYRYRLSNSTHKRASCESLLLQTETAALFINSKNFLLQMVLRNFLLSSSAVVHKNTSYLFLHLQLTLAQRFNLS